jgi:dihydroorotase
LVDQPSDIEKVFRIAKRRDVVVCVHAEEEALIKADTASAREKGWDHARFHSRIRTAQAEENAIRACLQLREKVGNRLHVCHLSSAAGLELIRESKAAGNGLLSCEVTPNHLFLSEDDAERLGNLMKINPSIKSRADQAALWKGLRDGTIDIVSTDHAPHTVAEKKLPYSGAPSGIPGVETMVPLLLEAVSQGKLSLDDIARLCARNPHRIFSLTPKPGCFSVVDPSAEQVIESARLHSKCGWSAFEGMRVRGTVAETYVNGFKVFHGGIVEADGRKGELL